MGNVVELRMHPSAAEQLRTIADMIDRGEFANKCTVIVGTEVFHCGATRDDRAAEAAIYDMTFGIHKLMTAALSAAE